MNWDIFLAPYIQAVDELKIKFKGMRKQFDYESRHSPIEFVTGRVKPITSIIEKAKRRGIALSRMEEDVQDIAGLRVVCPFVEDIYEIVELFQKRQDFQIIEEKDYIEKNKESGYRSYHIVIMYPVDTIYGVKEILAEVQIRTLAMNFWAINEHSLNYKYAGQLPEEVQTRLRSAAEAAFRLDEEMSKIRQEIQDAQMIFRQKKD